jgi:hypothetical protein
MPPPRARAVPARFGDFDEDSAGEAETKPARKKAKAAGQGAGAAPEAAAAAPIKLTLTLGGAPLSEAAITEAATAAAPEPEGPQHSKEELQLLQKYAELREALLARERRAGGTAGVGADKAATSVSDAVAMLQGDSGKEASARKRPSAKRGRSGSGSGMGLAAPPRPAGALGSGGAVASEDWD